MTGAVGKTKSSFVPGAPGAGGVEVGAEGDWKTQAVPQAGGAPGRHRPRQGSLAPPVGSGTASQGLEAASYVTCLQGSSRHCHCC